jgi:integrase
VEAIAAPADGSRVVVLDSDTKGFCIRVSAGARVFYLVRKISGRTQRIRIGAFPDITPEAARKIADQLNGEVAQGKDLAAERRRRRQPGRTDPTFGEVLEHALEHHWKPRCRTWKQMEQTFDCYSKPWRGRRLSSVSKVDLIAAHGRIGQKHGKYVANRWRSLLHRLYEIAADDFDYPGANPVRRVKPFTEEERERFVTEHELPSLFDAIDAAEDVRIADFLRLALLTGARKGALLRMRFADVDLARAIWTIPSTDSKNKSPIHVPLVADAVEIIGSRMVAAKGREYVFPGRHGKGFLSDPTKPIAKVFAAAGLKDVRLHDLRRTYGSWQAANGSSELLIGKSLGHRNTASTKVYARLTLDPVRQSVERATAAMQAVVQADRERRKNEPKRKRKGRG